MHGSLLCWFYVGHGALDSLEVKLQKLLLESEDVRRRLALAVPEVCEIDFHLIDHKMKLSEVLN